MCLENVEVIFGDMKIGVINKMNLFMPAVEKIDVFSPTLRKEAQNAFAPDSVSNPCETIKDLLDEKGWSVPKFAEKLGIPVNIAHLLVKGREEINGNLADKLGELFGTTSEFWTTREKQYRETSSRLRKVKNEEKLRRHQK